MKKYNIGFIGSGKMASAIIKGLLKSNFIHSENVMATQAETEGLDEKSKELGINIILDNKLLANNSDIIFIATKPNQVVDVLKEISSSVTPEKLIVSIAAGVKTSKIESYLVQGSRIVRVMPNTPALVGEGMCGIVAGKFATKEDLDYINSLFSTIGKSIIVDDESQMDIVTAISGSRPAFFY